MINSSKRRFTAREIRVQAAESNFLEPSPIHANNGDEDRYPNRIGSSTKGLKHDAAGEVDPAAYEALLKALATGDPADFAALASDGHLGCIDLTRRRRFVNPQSGYAFDLIGGDSYQFVIPPAPAFASAQEASEMVELYWMSLLRDVAFDQYGVNPVANAAASDLSTLSDFRGPKVAGAVTTDTLFRDDYPGCLTGPYISQFLLQPVNFGAHNLDTKINSNIPSVDFVTTFPEWLDNINGCAPTKTLTPDGPFYCRNGRDLSQYVHVDVLFQAYFVACLNLLGNSYPAAPGAAFYPLKSWNPYGRVLDASGTGRPLPTGFFGAVSEVGFGTFGAPAIATLVCEAATRALKAQWYQKWLVHRRLRPEEFGGHVEAQRLALGTYPFHNDLMITSTVLPAIAAAFGGTNLLPLAYPEGSPQHTSYGSGHATVAGACVTMLKAFFDDQTPIINPVVPDAGGMTLLPYAGPTLTVGGELNKIASNISQGRNIAGVHWRTDAGEANKLGEEVAISMLRDMREMYNEPFTGFAFTRFDGTAINI